ncbi:MAG: class I SAM-dependent rRNA methyltransferase [Pseudomonadota bacterium]
MTAPSFASAYASALPVVRLRPKANSRALRHGFPWVYNNELVIDRRTKALAPGSIAVLEDAERKPIATVAVNPLSKIICRVLDRDLDCAVDQAWLVAKLHKALRVRDRYYQQPYYRLVHAEADGLPGLVIDRFADSVVVQPNAAWIEGLLPQLTSAVQEVLGVETVLKNASGRTRKLEGLDDVNAVLAGHSPDAPTAVPMNGATYFADLTGGQKTGLFFDQRGNHAFTANLAQGARVLDVFSHVGGFALACLAGGAVSALAVDGSEPALSLARRGADTSGFDERFDARCGDAFDVLSDLGAEGAKFDIVICDPPAFAPSKQALDAGLRAYERVARLATKLVAQDGILVLCSCSHAADLAAFRAACVRGIGRSGRHATILHSGFAGPDHPQLPQLAESGYLKSLFFQL